jgi:hypothetical protein
VRVGGVPPSKEETNGFVPMALAPHGPAVSMRAGGLDQTTLTSHCPLLSY